MESLNKDDLYDQILQPLSHEFGTGESNKSLPFHEWVAQSSLVVDGFPFTYKKHEYLIDVYKDDHPFTVDMKSAQMGLTIRAMLRIVHNARYRAFRGQLYFFPSRTDVTDFTKARMDPLIEENPNTIGQWIRDTDAANIKRVWNCFLYFRGMKSRVGLKSVPGDCIVYDELDEAPQNAVDMADERMSHSLFKEKMMLSNPTLPDYGIHKHFLLCVAPDTKILRSDLRWIRASKIEIGDELIGFDEKILRKQGRRRYRGTRVINLKKVFRPSVKLYLDDGTTVVCSTDHRWLTEICTCVRFKYAKNMKPGDKLFSVGTWHEEKSYDAGWIAGVFDGEGYLGRYEFEGKNRGGFSALSFAQTDNIVLKRAKRLLIKYGFNFREDVDHRSLRGKPGRDITTAFIRGLPERLRFMGTFRPKRLMQKSRALWEGVSVGNDQGFTKKPKIVKIESLGIIDLIAIQTEHGTYIANGLLSHNSDQKFWLLKCEHCGQYNNLVDDFPGCLLEIGGKVIRACRKCKKELNPAIGEWVAKKPSVTERSGRQYSQLYSQFVEPAAILHIFRTTSNPRDLYNLKIGVPYIEAENRLSVEEVKALCSNDGISSSEIAPCFMGVDQGKGLHVVIGKDHETKAGKIVHLNIYKEWEELDGLMKNFNITRAVVDAQPEMRNARAFAGRFKGRVYLNFYREYQKGHYKWDEENLTVACNRTESLDASHNEIKFGQIILPKECDIVQTFAEHLHNVGKKLEEDEETGSKRYVYVRLGEDHFRHAYNYEAMARQHASGLLYPELL